MNRGNVVILAAGFSVALSCSSAHIDSSADIRIQGSVASVSDQLPVKDAQVSLIDESLDDHAAASGEFVRETVATDVGGRFMIDHFLFWGKNTRAGTKPTQGTLRIEIHKTGFSPAVYSVELRDFAYDEGSGRSLLDLGTILLSERPDGQTQAEVR